MSLDASDVASEFSLSEDELTLASLRAFMLEQLRLLEADRKARCAKYGVANLWDMEKLMEQGKVDEEVILEDFQKVDYLTTRVQRIKAMLEKV